MQALDETTIRAGWGRVSASAGWGQLDIQAALGKRPTLGVYMCMNTIVSTSWGRD